MDPTGRPGRSKYAARSLKLRASCEEKRKREGRELILRLLVDLQDVSGLKQTVQLRKVLEIGPYGPAKAHQPETFRGLRPFVNLVSIVAHTMYLSLEWRVNSENQPFGKSEAENVFFTY